MASESQKDRTYFEEGRVECTAEAARGDVYVLAYERVHCIDKPGWLESNKLAILAKEAVGEPFPVGKLPKAQKVKLTGGDGNENG